jgi:hypothetical protein
LAIKAPVAVATTANITLSGEQTIDGVLTSESRILVKDQNTTTENGIYDTSSGAWTRALDFDGSRDAVKGLIVGITGGTVGANKTYRLTSDNPVVFGTSAITWVEYTVSSVQTGVLEAMGSNVASATTTDLGASDSDYVTVTGTTTITGLGSTTTRNHIWVKFAGVLTLTHNATSLILPTGENITTAAGDIAEFVRISGSNWQCVGYHPVSGNPVNNQFFRTESDIASATTTTLTTAANIWRITGTTTITSFGSSASVTYPIYFIRFAGVLTLTHNGTSLILPGSANITTANGDSATLQYLGSGNWKCLQYQKISGGQVATIARTDLPDGCIIQRTYAEYTANAALGAIIPLDDSIPQNTEGDEIVTATLTPTSATNRVRVSFTGFGSSPSGSVAMSAALFIDSAASAVRATAVSSAAANQPANLTLFYEYVPGDTSAHTYKIRVGSESATDCRMNGTLSARLFGGSAATVLIVEEIKAS